MGRVYKATKFPGVRYREHFERSFGRNPDRYYILRYRRVRGGPQVSEGLGWASEGWTPASAAEVLATIKRGVDTGEGPTSLAELREARLLEKRAAEEQRKDEERRSLPLRITVGEVAERYLAWARANRKTWKDVEQMLRLHVLPVLGGMRMVEVTSQAVEDLKATLLAKPPERGKRGTLAPATVTHALGVVRALFNYASEAPLYYNDASAPIFSGRNPARLAGRRSRGVVAPREDNRRLRILTEIETSAVRCDLSDDEGQDLHDLFLLGLDTGLRLGELVAVAGQHVVGRAEALRVLDTKSGRNRSVYPGSLYPETQDMLLRRRALFGGGLLFPGRNGGLRDTCAVTRRFGRIYDRVGINDGYDDPRLRAVVHTWRHTHATRMLERGVDIHTLKELLGHAEVSTTEIYLYCCHASKRARALASHRF